MVAVGTSFCNLQRPWRPAWDGEIRLARPFATERTKGAVERLDRSKDVLREYRNYEWLTEIGNVVVLNNGSEFADLFHRAAGAVLLGAVATPTSTNGVPNDSRARKKPKTSVRRRKARKCGPFSLSNGRPLASCKRGCPCLPGAERGNLRRCQTEKSAMRLIDRNANIIDIPLASASSNISFIHP